jgi:hypothetical protein
MPDEKRATANFRIHGAFVLQSRALFVLRGMVTSGAVSIGQHVTHPEGLDAIVAGVEGRLSDPAGGASQTALTFRYSGPAQLARWQTLAREGVELTLS